MSRDPSAIVITGLGTVDVSGCGRQATAKALADGTPLWSPIDRSAGFHRRTGSRLAGLARHDLSEWLSRGSRRRMSRPSQLAVAAASLAVADAGLELAETVADRPTAMVFSNAFGPSDFTEKILAQIEASGPMAVSPMLFTESVANAPAAQVALACRATGANLTITQREAGAVIALHRAAREVARGRAGCAIVVAVDEVTPLFHSIFDRFGALARTDRHTVEEAARPFDRRRNGFVVAEGATALMVETEATAEARGARVLARVGAASRGFDPRATATGRGPDAKILAPRLSRLIDPQSIDLVVTAASGAVDGDRLEAAILRQVWGQHPLPPLLAPKAVLGEQGGAQLAAAILALDGGSFSACPGFAEMDPALGVAPYAGGTPQPDRLLVGGTATGGAAAWIVLDRGTIS